MWTLLGAPLDSSGEGRGEERAPAALRAAGLAAALPAVDAGDVAPPLRNPVRDPATGILAVDDLRRASHALKEAVAAEVRSGRRPFVVGGDCSLLLGAIAGVREAAGRSGLWFVDGHADYLDGRSSPTGEAADMELAILNGDGPRGLVDLAGGPPLVRAADVVVLGHRPPDLSEEVAGELERVPDTVTRVTADEIAIDPGAVGRRFERELAARGGAWLHLDLDALDESALKAVTYPQSRGLDWHAFIDLVRPLLGSEALVGVSLADLNPDLDPTGGQTRQVVAAIEAALSRP